MLSESPEDVKEFSYIETGAELLTLLYRTEGIQALMSTLMIERKYKAVVRVYERVISLIELDQPEFGGIHSNPMNKFQILLMTGKSLRKIGDGEMSIEVLNICNDWSVTHSGKKTDDGIECLF